MTFLQAIIAYGVCWWLLLFMALPFGVRPQENPPEGVSRAAPKKTYLWMKAAIVTILAAFATWGIEVLLASGIISLH